ncbi:MAG: hypothetical protein WBZ48_07455 [Bacteroidota bacterium]
METIPYSRIFKIDWRWIGLNFCFFVSFHLLPSHIIYLMRLISPQMGGLYLIWIFGGIAVISFLIGYKSHKVTIWETTIASALYAIVLMAEIHQVWELKFFITSYWVPYWIIAIIAIATLSAWLGEYVKVMKERNRGQKAS